MKRVLLVSYDFPPVIRVNSLAAAREARGLAALGWEVHVLTVADPPTYLFDASLLESLPENVIVHTAWSFEPTRLLQWARRMRGSEQAANGVTVTGGAPKRNYTSLPQWAVGFFRSLFFPDEKIGWSPWAVRAAQRLHAELRFDAVFSNGPPYTDHVVGLRIARKLGLPWVAELMDPIVDNYAFKPPTALHAFLQRRLERSVSRRADAIAIATPPWLEALAERNPEAREKAFVLWNSFDEDDFAGPPPADHEGFVVAYVGTFQLTIRPDDLLDAVVRLREDPAMARDLRVRLVSPIDPEATAAIGSRGLEGVVERTGLVTHAEAIAEMRGADVLGLILGSEEESRGILTGKLPEYLASRTRILAIAPDGVATQTIDRARAGLSARPGDIDGICDALRTLYSQWRDGAVQKPDEDVVAQFGSSSNMRMLSERLTAISSGVRTRG